MTRIREAILPFAIFIFCTATVFAQETSGNTNRTFYTPLPHYNQFPMVIPISNLNQYPLDVPDNARFSVRFAQNYTAAHLYQESVPIDFGMDMEILQYRFDVAYAVNSDFTVMYSQAFTYMWDGFMDPFLNWYHDLLGLPNYGREKRPNNEYEFFLYNTETGDSLWDPRSRSFLVNSPVVGAFYQLLNREHQNLLIGAHFQFPTGDAMRGISSGGTDMAFSMMYTHRYKAVDILQMGQLTVPGNANSGTIWDSLEMHLNILSGVQYNHNDKSQFIVQFHYGTPYYSDVGNNVIGDYPLELVFGYRYTGRFGSYYAAFSEDLLFPSPDFTLSLGFQRSF
jgi:hypothetical protein